MEQMLNFLGRASAFNTLEPNNSCFINDSKNILIVDMGRDCFNTLINSVDLNNFENVYLILTHGHDDHTEESALLSNFLQNLGKKLNLIQTKNINDEFFSYTKLSKDLFSIISQDDENLKRFVKIRSMLVPHVKDFSSCALYIEFQGKKIFYSSDCCDIPFKIEECDNYYLEYSESGSVVHLSLKKVNEITYKNQIDKEKLFLMHIEERTNFDKLNNLGFKVAKRVNF